MNDHPCDSCGQPLERTVAELRNDFREKLKLAHFALDDFAEHRLSDTETLQMIKHCRELIEAVLRFGRTGTASDPKIDLSKTPAFEFVTKLADDPAASC